MVIGGNPQHDMASASAIGARSIRVMTGRLGGRGDAARPPDKFLDVASVLHGAFGVAA